jgi:hypothetical protein
MTARSNRRGPLALAVLCIASFLLALFSCERPDQRAARTPHPAHARPDTAECGRCHDAAELRRTIPRTFLVHDERFVRGHGVEAARYERACRQCHLDSDCLNCHDTSQTTTIEARRPDAITRSYPHRGDFLTRHAIEARSQSAACQRCHASADCNACHVRHGVSAARRGADNPHPPGWIGPDAGAQTFHGRAARRDIVRCSGCHEEGRATNCIRCHRVGGFGGNPHPNGWRSGRETNTGICRYCHEP